MAGLLCVFLVAVLGSVAGVQEENAEGGKCERIKLPLCQDLGYNWTAMPNLLGHADQKEAEQAMSSFEDVLQSGCSLHARFLLCSAFAPLCSEQVSGAVMACRALCESVLAECSAQLAAGLGSGVAVDCAAFPEKAPGRLCMRPPNASEPGAPEPGPPPAPRWPFVEREEGCPPAHARDPTGACRPACGLDVAYTRGEKRAADAWAATLAWLSLVSTAFALLTFCAAPARYRYPERPIVWVAACHGAVAAAHAARGWLGARALSCAGPTLAADGLTSPACVTFFAITYYFTLAADAWFANACVAWYLTAASEWSTEALERAAAYLHAAAWGWAGAWTAAALALRRVAADELTGTCGVADAAAAALVGVPRGALLAASAALAAGACPGVLRVRRALDPRGAGRVGRLAARAAALGALYLALAAAGAAARVYAARARTAGDGAVAGAAVLASAGLWCGPAAGAWAWSRKSAAVWRRALCPPRKPPCCAPPLLRAHHPYYKRPLHVSRV